MTISYVDGKCNMYSEINLPDRKNLRYKNYNYSNCGVYYITICTKNNKNYFGKLYPVRDISSGIIIDCGLKRNKIADVVENCWKKIPDIYPYIENDIYTIMPNHIHGIISILNNDSDRTLTDILRAFKSVTTREFKKIYGINDSLWQRNYYDTIISNEKQYDQIVNYIINNRIRKITEKYCNN